MIARPTLARLLFVDDEPLIHEALNRQLYGYRNLWSIEFLSDPLQAERLIETERFDAMLVDYRMPGMNGLELCQKARAADPNLAVLMLTGHIDLDVALSAVNEGGIFRLYTKPCPLTDLVSGLEAAIQETRRHREQASILNLEAGSGSGPHAVFDITPDGQVRWMNREAARMLQGNIGLVMSTTGSVTPAVSGERRRFQLALAGVARTGTEESFSLETDDADDRLLLTLTRNPAPSSGAPPSLTLIAVAKSRRPCVDANRLKGLFGLSEKEAQLACLLAIGISLTDAAEEIGLKESSARTYLKTIFAKMGVTRQPELVKVILTSTAVLASTPSL